MSKSSEPTQVSEGIYVYCIIAPTRHGALGTGGSTLEPVATRSRQQQERS